MYRALLPILAGVILLVAVGPSRAQPGMGYVIEEIEVRGNHKTTPEFIRRSMPLHEGDRLTPDRISATREALYQTRLFRTVHVASRPGTEEGKAVLVVFVDEKRFGDVGASFEYSELDGFGVAADAYHVNLWGEGKWAGVEFERGERIRLWGVSYTDPWFAGSKVSLHVRAVSTSYDHDLYRTGDMDYRGSYDLDRTGGAIGAGWPMGPAHRLILSYGISDVQVGSYVPPSEPVFGGEYAAEVESAVGRNPFSYFSLQLSRNPSGRPWGTHPGHDFNLAVDYSAEYLGSDDNFMRIRAETARHLQAWPDHIFTLAARGGVVLGGAPFYERFFLEGPYQLRGFEQRKIGPEGGTRFLSAEARFCLPVKPLGRLYGFGEWAHVSRAVDGGDRADSGKSIGIGVLLFNRVDMSFGINTGTLIVRSHRFGGINVGL